MGKVWVLDTGTKGTGAEMVPLEKVLDGPGSTRALVLAPTKRRPSAKPPEASPPWRFKVVDVMTRSVLAEDADARATVDLLKGMRSIVDVSVYAWDATAAQWRALTLGESTDALGLPRPSAELAPHSVHLSEPVAAHPAARLPPPWPTVNAHP